MHSEFYLNNKFTTLEKINNMFYDGITISSKICGSMPLTNTKYQFT